MQILVWVIFKYLKAMHLYLYIKVCLIACFAVLFVKAKLKKAKNKSETKSPKLTINNCRGKQYDFDGDGAWSININDHCGQKLTAYTVDIHVDDGLLVDGSGLYEPYGISDGVVRYEYVLKNGTTFQLKRFSQNNMGYWLLTRGLHALALTISEMDSPPLNSIWGEVQGNSLPSYISPDESVLTITKHKYKRKKRKRVPMKLKLVANPPAKESNGDEKILNSMLHPAIGRAFGAKLHDEYHASEPYPGIAIDFALNNKKLLKALDFLNTPINIGKFGWNSDSTRNLEIGEGTSDWVGPEEVAYCCKQKYRLDFQHWRGSKYSRALQSITSSSRFIGFLEEMSGIPGLIPMRVHDERILWAGSTIIGVKPGGYLLSHNDVGYLWKSQHVAGLFMCLTIL